MFICGVVFCNALALLCAIIIFDSGISANCIHNFFTA